MKYGNMYLQVATLVHLCDGKITFVSYFLCMKSKFKTHMHVVFLGL